MHGKRAEGERVRLFMVGEVGAQRQRRGGYMSSVFFFRRQERKEKSFRVQSEDLTENHMRIPFVSRESRVYIM